MNNRPVLLAVALITIAALIFYFESTKPKADALLANHDIEVERLGAINLNYSGNISNSVIRLTEADKERIKIKSGIYKRAKELVSPEGYINADNITLAEHIGKDVILIDFWTYSCINCQRTFPYLTSWYEKYKDKGLVIIGVHTPEFGFEEKYANVAKAAKKWNITYPVVQDNDRQTWTAYKNLYWPRKYLVDIDGFIVYDHIGEGAYEETEKKIQMLLIERNKILGLKAAVDENMSIVEAEEPEFQKIRTPEIYLGYGFERAQMGNAEGWVPESVVEYALPKEININSFYLEGSWKNNNDNMELAGKEGKIVLKYNAKIINIVAGAQDAKDIVVLIDGKKTGTVKISNFDLYTIYKAQDYAEHTAELQMPRGVMVYTFTFG